MTPAKAKPAPAPPSEDFAALQERLDALGKGLAEHRVEVEDYKREMHNVLMAVAEIGAMFGWRSSVQEGYNETTNRKLPATLRSITEDMMEVKSRPSDAIQWLGSNVDKIRAWAEGCSVNAEPNTWLSGSEGAVTLIQKGHCRRALPKQWYVRDYTGRIVVQDRPGPLPDALAQYEEERARQISDARRRVEPVVDKHADQNAAKAEKYAAMGFGDYREVSPR
jgi:hypothetical protein